MSQDELFREGKAADMGRLIHVLTMGRFIGIMQAQEFHKLRWHFLFLRSRIGITSSSLDKFIPDTATIGFI